MRTISRPLLSPVVAVVFAAAVAPPVVAQVVAYHDVTAASHQTQFNTLTAQGYRLEQLSVAGGLSSARYSAVWRAATGPSWVASHDMTLVQYLNQRATWIGQGYRAKLVTAAGSGADIVFAAMFVADGATVVDLFGNSEASFETTCDQQRGLGRWPVSVDIYNTQSSPWYTAVFEPNTSGDAWGHVIDDDATAFDETCAAFAEAQARLAALGMSETQRYVSVWRDDRLGSAANISGQTSSNWATTSSTQIGFGRDPRILASGGSGSARRFAGSFTQYHTPLARSAATTGIARPAFSAFDNYMTSVLNTNRARNAAIAITKDGRLVFARGYTWGESGTQLTQPTSLFRIASMTKVLTAIAVQKLVQDGQVSLSDKPKSILGLSGGGTNFGNVSLLHCLEYASGMERNYSGIQAAQYAHPGVNDPPLPASHAQAVDWLSSRPFWFSPGSAASYCNTGFLLASQVVRHVSGQSMQTWLQNNLYTPLDINRARVAASLSANLAVGELRGQAPELYLAKSNLVTAQPRKASQWSADLGLADGSGGMAFSVVDWARVMAGTFGLGADWIVLSPTRQGSMLTRHTFPAGPYEPITQSTPGSFSWTQRPNGVYVYNKSGDLSDCKTRTFWRTDGISVTVLVNRGDAATDIDYLNDLVDAVSSWPTDDLFPTYGLPTFPRRPVLTGLSTTSIPNVGNAPIVATGERFDTVTSVQFGPYAITDTTPANWHSGWFRVLSPTQMEVYPPQGLPYTWYGLGVTNPVGSSSPIIVQVDPTTGPMVTAAPPWITPSWTFRVYCGTGSLPALSIAMMGFSTSNVSSSAPGIVDLGIGNGFSNLVWTDPRFFDAGTDAVFWTIPPLPWPDFHVQAIAFDLTVADPWPLPASNVRSVDVQ